MHPSARHVLFALVSVLPLAAHATPERHAQIDAQRQRLDAARKRVLASTAARTTMLEIGGVVATFAGLRLRVGLARTTEGGQSQLRLVASTGAEDLAIGGWLYAQKVVEAADGKLPFRQRVHSEAHVPLIGSDQRTDANGAGVALGLGFADSRSEGETRFNILRLPLTPKLRSPELRRIDKGLGLLDQVGHALVAHEEGAWAMKYEHLAHDADRYVARLERDGLLRE